ncbi:MAG TPA: hypothetical protein VIV65_00590 [Gemmatimonadaceae bacterium]
MTESLKSAADRDERYSWLTPEALSRVRATILGVTLLVGMAVYVFHTLAPATARPGSFVYRLRGVGALTWVYALVQMIDMRFYNSRFAQRRRASVGIPDSLHGWLFAQMLAWYGILYYGLTEDPLPFVAGMVILVLAFWIFPIRRGIDR